MRDAIKKLFSYTGIKEVLSSLLAVSVALAIGAVLIWVSGHDVGKAYFHFYNGCFGSVYNLSQCILKTVPLIFTGLTVAIGFQAGLFNIGGEGQLYCGAFASTVMALNFSQLPGVLLIPMALMAGALAGGLWGIIPGYLKARTGAHEVVTTIMLNYVGILLTTFLLKQFFKEAGPIAQSPLIPEAARLPELISYSRLTWGIFVGIGVIGCISVLLRSTALGYELRAVGKNGAAAEYAGINRGRMMAVATGIGGAVAGLGGSVMVMGILNRFIPHFSPGYGFTGIAVAVLGRNSPWGVLLAALLFGILETGGMSMQLFAKIPISMMTIIQGLVIMFAASPALFIFLKR